MRKESAQADKEPEPDAKKAARTKDLVRGGFMSKDSGDNRLSRQRHYHRPGGLNGRVRDGNGCDPASMVAGNVPGRRSGAAGHWISDCWSHVEPQTVWRMSGSCSTTYCQTSLTEWHADRWTGCCLGSFKDPEWQRPDRGGQAAWLLGPVG